MGVLKIGIVGAGIGGLAAANALHQAGHDVVVFEQSRQFLRVGADINLTPNAVRASTRATLCLGPQPGPHRCGCFHRPWGRP